MAPYVICGKSMASLRLRDSNDQSISEPQHFAFCHPFTAILAGPSGSGKTTLLKKILQKKDTLIFPPPQTIIWYYKRWQPDYEELLETVAGIEFREGVTRTSKLFSVPYSIYLG